MRVVAVIAPVHLSALGVDVNNYVAISTTNHLSNLERVSQLCATKSMQQWEQMTVRTEMVDVFTRTVEVRQLYLTRSILEVALQKSTPPKIRQLVFHYYFYKE